MEGWGGGHGGYDRLYCSNRRVGSACAAATSRDHGPLDRHPQELLTGQSSDELNETPPNFKICATSPRSLDPACTRRHCHWTLTGHDRGRVGALLGRCVQALIRVSTLTVSRPRGGDISWR